MTFETENDAQRTPQAEQTPTVLQELLSIAIEQEKLTARLKVIISQEGNARAALLCEVEKIVGNTTFITKSVFDSLPNAIEEHGPSAFPALSQSNANSLGKALSDVANIGTCGGYEVRRVGKYQGSIQWRLVAL